MKITRSTMAAVMSVFMLSFQIVPPVFAAQPMALDSQAPAADNQPAVPAADEAAQPGESARSTGTQLPPSQIEDQPLQAVATPTPEAVPGAQAAAAAQNATSAPTEPAPGNYPPALNGSGAIRYLDSSLYPQGTLFIPFFIQNTNPLGVPGAFDLPGYNPPVNVGGGFIYTPFVGPPAPPTVQV